MIYSLLNIKYAFFKNYYFFKSLYFIKKLFCYNYFLEKIYNNIMEISSRAFNDSHSNNNDMSNRTNKNDRSRNKSILSDSIISYNSEGPIKLIDFEGSKFKLNPIAIDFLKSITEDLVIVSVVGKARTGKSYLMNLLLDLVGKTKGVKLYFFCI